MKNGLTRFLLTVLGLIGLFSTPVRADSESPYVLFRTTLGDMVVELLPRVAPKTVAQFKKIISLGDYNGTPIYRIEPGFVAQVSDVRYRSEPLSEEQLAAIVKIPAEFSRVPHLRGVLSMAREDNDINSGQTSFSFLLNPAPHLDGKYTVFGRVVRGDTVLTRFSKVPTDSKSAPKIPIRINEAILIDRETALTLQLELPSLEDIGGTASVPGGNAGVAIVSLCVLITLTSFATAVAAVRRQLRFVNSLALTTLLATFFLLFTFVTVYRQRDEHWQQIYATAAFVGALLCFKLLSRFETSDPPR